MNNRQIAILALGGLGAGALVFTGSRLALRSKVEASIEASDGYRKASLAAKAASLLGVSLGLPPPAALAAAIVPVFSTISPYEAAEDIVIEGRNSRYWPAEYRQSDIPPQVEQLLMRVMVNLSQSEQLEAA